MKKVLILQNIGKSTGGVWFLNRTIGEALLTRDYQVEILSVRQNQSDNIIEHDLNLKVFTINEEDSWEITRKSDILDSLKKFDLKGTFINFKNYIKEHKKLKEDYQKVKKYIFKYNPDYIITSHYQCLDAVPKEYYNRTINEQHSSFKDVIDHRDNYNKLKKYSKKISKMVWLSKSSSDLANKLGFENNTYIYNPVRFNNGFLADVAINKKLIVVTRIENTIKRIDLMIRIADEVLKNFDDWSFEIYGEGPFNEESSNIMKNNPKIKFMGLTKDPESVLLSSSINLNTSLYEGFSLSILEAAMCGIPTVSFDFGESVVEQIIDGQTGYIIKNDNIEEYKNKLQELMKDNNQLLYMSKEVKKFSSNFLVDNIINDWIRLFEQVDKNN